MDPKTKIFKSLGKAYYKFMNTLLLQENWKGFNDQQPEQSAQIDQQEKSFNSKKIDKVQSITKPEAQTREQSRPKDTLIQIFNPGQSLKPQVTDLKVQEKNKSYIEPTHIPKKKIYTISEGEEEYKCKECNINFSRKTELDKHNETHNIDFQFEDDI